MAEPIKSVLYVDFDSLKRSLVRAGGEAAARLATRVPAWTAAIESGRLIDTDGGARQILVKRCYADPGTLGAARGAFAAADFEIVECPADIDGARHADLSMAIDATEALTNPAEYDEFIVLSAEPTLTALLTRLKVHKRRTAIYADATTPPAYRSFADAILEIAAFAEFLLTQDASEAAANSPDRAAIEAFARKIHAATNIPLFSPKTFAELFSHLTNEINASGYHFQSTAKNVAERLVETGRSVTRRQVMFVVKGLALKGHVFSSDDTPRRLAEVFREQTRYLLDNAGVTLDDKQEALLNAWLVDRVPVKALPPTETFRTRTGPAARTPGPAADQRAGADRTGSSTPAVAAKAPPADAATDAPTPAQKKEAARPLLTGAALSNPAKPGGSEEPGAKPVTQPKAPPMISPEDARAAIAAKVSQARGKTPARPPPPTPAPSKSGDAETIGTSFETDEIENSILAAIAEAVDVLVEDTSGKPKRNVSVPSPKNTPAPAQKGAPPAAASRSATPAPPPAKEAPRPEPKSAPSATPRRASATAARPEAKPRPRPRPQQRQGEDIGDEIQRIIASYKRDRKDEPRD